MSGLLPAVRAHSGAANLSTLQTRDPSISRLLHTAKHVVLYELDQNQSTWKRLEVEGAHTPYLKTTPKRHTQTPARITDNKIRP